MNVMDIAGGHQVVKAKAERAIHHVPTSMRRYK